MTTVLKHSVFVHISKTGGTWITTALRNAGLAININCNKNFSVDKHFTVDEIKEFRPHLCERVFFAFIRNPVTWWQSRWACNFNRRFFHDHRRRNPVATGCKQLIVENSILNKQEYNDFNVWLYRVLKTDPAFVSKHYKHYLGHNYDKVKYIGKYENLADDLISILHKIGEEFQPQDIVQTEMENVSKKNLNRRWDCHLLKKVIKHEREFMSRFGYSTSLADYT